MTTQQHRQDAERLEQEIRTKKRELSDRCIAWAEEYCPHKIGDVVEVPRRSGAEFVGKKVRVAYRRAGFAKVGAPEQDWAWELAGEVLNKDGTPFRRGTAFHSFQVPMKEVVS